MAKNSRQLPESKILFCEMNLGPAILSLDATETPMKPSFASDRKRSAVREAATRVGYPPLDPIGSPALAFVTGSKDEPIRRHEAK